MKMIAEFVDKEKVLGQLRDMLENDAVAEMCRLLSDPGSDVAIEETESKVADVIGTIEVRAARMADREIVPGYLEFARNLRGLRPDERIRNVYLETQNKSFCLTVTAEESRFVGCISFAKGPRVLTPPDWAGTIEPPMAAVKTPDPKDPEK